MTGCQMTGSSADRAPGPGGQSVVPMFVVPGVGIEPTHLLGKSRGLSPLRLPFRHPGNLSAMISAHGHETRGSEITMAANQKRNQDVCR